MQWTEQQICHALDGSFTKLTDDGRLVTRKVPRGFIPPYDPPGEQKQASSTKGEPRGPYRPWTEADDARLIDLRTRERLSKENIARAMRRCLRILRVRFAQLAAEGRIA